MAESLIGSELLSTHAHGARTPWRCPVKTLRVVALEFRAAGIGSNGNRGPGGGALVSTPVSIGNGAWDPKIILGDATVYDDFGPSLGDGIEASRSD